MIFEKSISSDDGCIALINPNRYKSVKDEMPSSEEFLEEAKTAHILVWGAARGNWNITISTEQDCAGEFQSIEGSLISDGELIFLTHEELIDASNYESFPPEAYNDRIFKFPKGMYICKVSMLFDPGNISESESLESKKTHFYIYLKETEKMEKALESVHWYDFDRFV